MFIPIKKFPHYSVDEYGNMRNEKYNRVLNPSTTYQGYLSVELWEKGKRKHYMVHRLVAETFIPNPDNLPVVHHKDSNRKNNHYSNLEWTTEFENFNYMQQKNSRGRITKEAVLKLYKRKQWMTAEEFLIEIIKY